MRKSKIENINKKRKEITYILLTALITSLIYRKVNPLKVNRILLIRQDKIGDLVMTLPVIKTLRLNFPKSYIAIAVSSLTKELIKDNPYINEIIVYDSEFFMHKKSNLKYKLSFMNLVKSKDFDLVINMRADFGTFLLSLFKPSKYFINWETKNVFDIIKERNIHKVESYLEVLNPLEPNKFSKEFFIADSESKWVNYFLNKNKIKKFVVIHVGSGWIYRNWPKENFAKLTDWIISNKKMQVIFVGSKDEIELCNSIKNMMKEKPIILTGKISLKKCASLLKRANLFIGNDSGIGHISVAMGTRKIISLFGPENSIKYKPYNKKTCVIQKKMHCSPCNQFYCKHPENSCMKQIKVEDVIERIK